MLKHRVIFREKVNCAIYFSMSKTWQNFPTSCSHFVSPRSFCHSHLNTPSLCISTLFYLSLFLFVSIFFNNLKLIQLQYKKWFKLLNYHSEFVLFPISTFVTCTSSLLPTWKFSCPFFCIFVTWVHYINFWTLCLILIVRWVWTFSSSFSFWKPFIKTAFSFNSTTMLSYRDLWYTNNFCVCFFCAKNVFFFFK